MTSILWLPLVARALATGLIVVSASIVAEALGPVWGAIIASQPVSAGPAYVFLAMQHGPAFVAESALHSAASNAATGLFLIVYARFGARWPLWQSLGSAIVVWLAAGLLLQQIAWTVASVSVVNLAVYGAGLCFNRAATPAESALPRAAQRRWFELPLRAVAVAGFVSAIVAVSAALGPGATGLAAVFPISLVSLIVILRLRLGGPATAHVAGKALAPMLGFGVMLLVLHVGVRPFGFAAAFSLALAVTVVWSAGLLLLHALGRRQRRTHAGLGGEASR